MLQPNFNSLTCVKKVSHDVKVNAEALIKADEEIKKPVSIKAEVFVTAIEKGEAETLVKGQVVFEFVYLAEDGYKKIETNTEISAKIPLSDPVISVSAEDVRITNSENGYLARANAIIKGVSDASKTYGALAGGDDLFIREFTREFDVGTGMSSDTLTVEDEFEVGYAVAEVLMHRESVELKEVVGGISAVIFDGEVNIALSLLPFSENSDILKEKRTVPFRFEMENVGALPTMRAYGETQIKKVAVKVVADEGKGKSTITIELVLGFTGEAVDETSVTMVEDAYSATHALSIKRDNIEYQRFVGQYTYGEKISGTTDAEAIEGGRLITALGERLNVYSAATENGRLRASGTVVADVIFRNADNGTTVVKAETPFDIDTEVTGEAAIGKIALTDFNVKLRNGGIEFDFAIAIDYRLYENMKTVIISEVAEGEEREVNESAITVYIPTDNDELWDVAKTLGESEENILKYNPELTFPLKAEDRVIIYRQKL